MVFRSKGESTAVRLDWRRNLENDTCRAYPEDGGVLWPHFHLCECSDPVCFFLIEQAGMLTIANCQTHPWDSFGRTRVTQRVAGLSVT